MKNILLLFAIVLFSFFSIYSFAQVPTAQGAYQWVKGFGSFNQQGITDEMVNAMKLDNEGNTIVCGRVMGYTYVQGLGGKKDSLVNNRWQNANNFQGFISKYDCNGNTLWYKELNDSMSNTDIYDFVVDSSDNIYVFGKCNAGNRATYFDDSLFAPYTSPNVVIGPPILFSLTKNGKMRWNWIPPYVTAFSRLYITPQFQNHSGNQMCNTMVLHHDTINLLAFTSPLSSTPLTIGNTIFKRGYNIIRFNLSGQLIDAERVDSNNAVFTGFGIDEQGNYIAGFNFEDTVVTFLDSVFHRSTSSDFNPLSTIIKFNRHHVIRHIEFGDSTSARAGNFNNLSNGFNLVGGGKNGNAMYGGLVLNQKSSYGSLSGTGGILHFDDINNFKWMTWIDTSTNNGAFKSPISDVNGDVYSHYSYFEYFKFKTLTLTKPINIGGDVIVKMSRNNGSPIAYYQDYNTSTPITSSGYAEIQNLAIKNDGNLIISGNIYNNQVIVGTDTAKYYGGNNDMFVMRYGNPCSNTAPLIAAGTPSGLVAKCNGTAIILSWQKLNNGEDKYYIYRSLAATSGFVKIDSVAPTINTYTDANVVSKTNYWYAISSHNMVGEGYLSMVDSARLCDDSLGGFVSLIAANSLQGKIYPNPTTSDENMVLYLQSTNTENATLTITNVVGEILYQKPINIASSGTTIPLTIGTKNWSAGTYLLAVKTASAKQYLDKLVILK